MGKTYRTMQGKVVDMERLRSQNELTPAVGNMNVNARGDEIGKGGKIVRTREQIMSKYYDNNPKATPDVDYAPKQTAKTPEVTKFEDTPVAQVFEEIDEPPATVEEEKALDSGAEAVQRARARRKGISDATGGSQ